jgi:two-component system sensor histidine kinase ArlS
LIQGEEGRAAAWPVRYMSKILLEAIRTFLRRTVLPFRRKREQWLSNFRLSIAFRISLAYLKLLITHGVLLFVGFFIIFISSEKNVFEDKSKEIIEILETGGDEALTNPYQDEGLTMKIERSGMELFDDIAYPELDGGDFLNGIHIDLDSPENAVIINDDQSFSIDGTEYSARFQYNLSESYERYLSISWKLILLYIIVIALIIRKGKRSDVKLLEPIRVMSATANRLTVNNLHSERLNVEGTKNELKDLANVINAMLNRIETSYESQKQFVSDASHELRTPIAVIQGYINMLNRWGSSNEEVLQESIEAIQNEARSMQDLVEKLLYLSRHDKKTLKLTKKRFNMRPLVEDMVKETRLMAGRRIINNPVMEDVIVYGDKQALKQAIRIFIDNAVKYTKEDDEITILCQKINEDCVITVSDTGIGMTQKDIDHIFNRFYRSDHVRNQNISGHGLGLSLAKIIILAHTGKIKVRSQFKKGSSFIITIPKRRL